MKLIKPAPVTEASLTSNVAEDDAPGWNPAKTNGYAVGDKVMDAHHIWQWQGEAGKNTAVAPSADTTLPARWLDLGANRRWRMFDKKAGNTWRIGTATTNAETIDVTLKPGQVVNSIALFGMEAATVQIIMTAPGGKEVYNETFRQQRRGVNNWYEYYFTPIDRAETMVRTNLPAYGQATVRVIVSNPGGQARVGLLVLGRLITIGESIYGTSVGIQSYSRTDIDDFGNETIIARGSRRTVDYDVRIPTEDLSRVTRILDQLRDTVCPYIGTEDMEATITVGRFENLGINIANPAYCEATAEVRSLN
ncbi:hypothetical protein V6W80_17090 [Pseudomonas benzopyrenica]|uniref:Minor tail protein n=1 Tax=Pseudomonas benzopyrenica TaxID=2993566 RepID=A0ABZ2FMI7_9PSED